jgi:hypothetical protein
VIERQLEELSRLRERNNRLDKALRERDATITTLTEERDLLVRETARAKPSSAAHHTAKQQTSAAGGGDGGSSTWRSSSDLLDDSFVNEESSKEQKQAQSKLREAKDRNAALTIRMDHLQSENGLLVKENQR